MRFSVAARFGPVSHIPQMWHILRNKHGDLDVWPSDLETNARYCPWRGQPSYQISVFLVLVSLDLRVNRCLVTSIFDHVHTAHVRDAGLRHDMHSWPHIITQAECCAASTYESRHGGTLKWGFLWAVERFGPRKAFGWVCWPRKVTAFWCVLYHTTLRIWALK